MKHNMRADLVVRDVLYWVHTGSQPTIKTTTTMATTTVTAATAMNYDCYCCLDAMTHIHQCPVQSIVISSDFSILLSCHSYALFNRKRQF